MNGTKLRSFIKTPETRTSPKNMAIIVRLYTSIHHVQLIN